MASFISSAPAAAVSQGTKNATVGRPAAANPNLIKRLQSELMALMTSPTPGISAFPATPTDMTVWNATLTGPSDTPYENLTFKLKMSFPGNYPLAPPEVTFKTPVYHPNIDFSGRICLDILKPAGSMQEGAWSAVLNVSTVLLSIQSLLGEPNVTSPLNGEAALLWGVHPDQYKQKVLARHQEPAELES